MANATRPAKNTELCHMIRRKRIDTTLLRSGSQDVTHAAHRVNEPLIRIEVHLRSKQFHESVERVAFEVVAVIPNFLDDCIARDDTVATFHQQLKNRVLRACKDN